RVACSPVSLSGQVASTARPIVNATNDTTALPAKKQDRWSREHHNSVMHQYNAWNRLRQKPLPRQRDLPPFGVAAFQFEMLGKEALAAEYRDELFCFVLELHVLPPFAVVEIRGDFIIYADRDPSHFRLLAGQSQHPHDFDCHAFGRFHDTATAAAGTI